MKKPSRRFLRDILIYDWKSNYEKHSDEIARSNFSITMGGALITVFVLALVMIFEYVIGYRKLVAPYLCGIPVFLCFAQGSFQLLKRNFGVKSSLITIYVFALFIFMYVMAIHDYVGDFQIPHFIPLFMCLVFFPMLIVDVPGRKLVFQIFLSLALLAAMFYFFNLEPYLAFVTITNVIILSATSYLSACVLLYQRLETYSALKNAEYMSRHDMATGLRNRATFFEEFTEKKENISGAVVIDINDFKHINDTYGHIVGDEAILHVASVLKQYHNHDSITFYRYGGDEFVGLFTKDALNTPCTMAEIVQNQIASKPMITSEGLRVPLTVSAGSADYVSGETAERLVTKADEKMYEVKQASKCK